MFNKVVLAGNLTRDIELRYTPSGTGVAKTAIATSRKFTSNGEKKEEVCFVDITFFGRSSEVANQYLRKGSKILVEGRLSFDQWVDQNGQKKSKHSVIVETMQMLDSRSDGGYAPTRDATNEDIRHHNKPRNNYQDDNSHQEPPIYRDYDNNPDHTAYREQPKTDVPNPNTLPEVDIDSEIPF